VVLKVGFHSSQNFPQLRPPFVVSFSVSSFPGGLPCSVSSVLGFSSAVPCSAGSGKISGLFSSGLEVSFKLSPTSSLVSGFSVSLSESVSTVVRKSGFGSGLRGGKLGKTWSLSAFNLSSFSLSHW